MTYDRCNEFTYSIFNIYHEEAFSKKYSMTFKYLLISTAMGYV